VFIVAITDVSCSILRSRSCGVQPAMSFLMAMAKLSRRDPSRSILHKQPKAGRARR
jgi:hypothetical protein